MNENYSATKYKKALIIVSALLIASLCALGLCWSKARNASEPAQAGQAEQPAQVAEVSEPEQPERAVPAWRRGGNDHGAVFSQMA